MGTVSQDVTGQRLQDGTYEKLATQFAVTGRGSFNQIQAQQALRARGITPRPVPMAAFARHALIWSGAGLASIMTGIAICLVHSLTGLGVVLIIAPFLAGIIWVIAAVARDAAEQHHGWISQHTPAQQAPIRQAENAAAWAATAAAAVALHESSKRNRARLGASVTGTGPPPGKAGAAMWAARQRDQAARERQELPGAIRQSGQDQDSQGLQPKRWVPPGTQQ